MAILEWKKFDFFNLVSNADRGKVVDTIRDSEITSCTSCSSQKIICDSSGMVHIFYRNWEPISFQGHNAPIILCAIASQNNLLVTISNRDFSDPPLVKVWDLSKATKRGGAPCVGSAKALLQKPTALAVAQGSGSQMFIAIGYERGEISLFRGSISRDFSNAFKNLTVGTKPIIGISFKHHGKLMDMFLCSESGVFVFQCEHDKESKLLLDSSNAATRCCALQTKGANETYFMTGKDDAVYCYTSDGRGPCYALEGQKHFIEWFPNYLVIIMKATKNSLLQQKEFALIVIDIQNKFLVFQTPIDPVVAILNEFGNCFIVTKCKKVFHLREKDIQSKLNMLFKKNLFDIAIRITKDLQFDEEGLASIYKQYADHLYIKGDYSGAVEKYVKTIGFIEPSYVIMKFLDSRHIKYLADYLDALYRKNQATAQHKTLLMNCRTRLDLPQKLDEFLFNEDEDDSNEMMFDINAAIRNQSAATMDFQDREELKEDYNISVLLKKIQDTSEMASLLAKLNEDDVYVFFKKFGLILMQHAPEDTTKLLKRLCREHGMSNFIEDHVNEMQISFSPEQFIPLFDGNWELLLDFLESCVTNASSEFHETVYNTLIELYLRKWQNSMITENQLLDILKLHRDRYNKEQVLIMCRMAQFWSGILYLYEDDQLYNLTIHYYVKNKDYNSLLSCCKSLGQFHPQLWIQALNELHNDPEVPMNILLQILNVITTEKLQSPLQILQCLAVERGPNISHVKDYYTQAFLKETTAINQEEKDVEYLQTDLKSLQDLIKNFQTNPIEFRNTVCDACTQPLTLPAVYFLCQHSFHQDCVRTYSENEKDCSICIVKNQQMAERLRTQQESQGQHETFHRLLNRSNGMLYVLSSYFGRGLLNQIVIVDEQKAADENQLNQNNLGYNWAAKHKDGDGPIAVEHVNNYKWSGRITAQDRELAATAQKQQQKKETKYDDSKNPFSEDSKNPFSEDPKNPFATGDDNISSNRNRIETYDKNLNPFGDGED